MAVDKPIKNQEIPFILDGQTIVKTVTKHTTCSDVINKLPNLSCPLAVFESVDGVEKELSGKSKLLKVWRAHGPNKKVEFVIRKSSGNNTGWKDARKLFSDRRRCEKPSDKSVHDNGLSKETLKQVSDLAFFARYQKTKVDALNRKSNGEPVTSEQEKLLRRMSSRASVNSMDAFLAKADLNEMAQFLNFCGGVTAEKLGKKVQKQQTTNLASEEIIEADKSNINKHMIQYSLTSLKLGLKEKFTAKSKVTRTTSTGTISSTDTGYQSTGSEDKAAPEMNPASQFNYGSSVPQRISDDSSGPRHSTPVCACRFQRRRADDIGQTFLGDCSDDKLQYLDETQGKSIILQKFMNDQSSLIGSDAASTSSINKQRSDRYSMPIFSNQEEKCRFLWNQCCGSDSDSESEASEPFDLLETAFHSETNHLETTLQSGPKTLRRESAISNLHRFSLVTDRCSLVSRDSGLDTVKDGTGFDYSFDCSFPTMDESQFQDFSLDLSYSFDDSESEANDSDHSVDSFMKTRSFHNVTDDVTILL